MNLWEKIGLFPKIISKVSSPINGEIKVVEQWGKRRILVGEITQSGEFIEDLWQKGIREILPLKKNLENVLILGLGGGTLAEIVAQKWPEAKIDGLEIDPLMIDLGKKYFDLGRIKNLNIIIGEAAKYIEEGGNKKYDLISVDVYQGEKFPKNCQTKNFLEKLKQKLTKNGLVIFNVLFFQNHIFEARNFLDKVGKIFNDITTKKIFVNLLIFAKDWR